MALPTVTFIVAVFFLCVDLTRCLPNSVSPMNCGDSEHKTGLSCSLEEAVKIGGEETDRFRLLPNGSFVLLSPTSGNFTAETTFQPSEFCVENTSHIAYYVCACRRVQCVHHCCGKGEASAENGSTPVCVKTPDWDWTPPFYPPGKAVAYEIVHDADPLTHCPRSRFQVEKSMKDKESHFLREWWDFPNGEMFKTTYVCADYVVKEGSVVSMVVAYCHEPRFYRTDNLSSAAIHCLAVMFLSLALAAHLMVPELRSSLHGWAVICHCVCLFSVNALFLNAAVYRKRHPHKAGAKCIFQDFVSLFSSLGANFWLNVICINMCLGFRKFHIATSRGTRFLYFSLYAWGCTAIITSVTVAVHFLECVPKEFMPTLAGTRTCWPEASNERVGTILYYYGPVSLLLVSNFVMFVMVALRIRMLQRGNSILNRDEDRRHDNSEASTIFLYVKIFLLMGVAEMLIEIAAWVFNNTDFCFLGMDIVDLLRAVLVFVLCCCKRRYFKRFCTSQQKK